MRRYASNHHAICPQYKRRETLKSVTHGAYGRRMPRVLLRPYPIAVHPLHIRSAILVGEPLPYFSRLETANSVPLNLPPVAERAHKCHGLGPLGVEEILLLKVRRLTMAQTPHVCANCIEAHVEQSRLDTTADLADYYTSGAREQLGRRLSVGSTAASPDQFASTIFKSDGGC
jgi:hypothetical protein